MDAALSLPHTHTLCLGALGNICLGNTLGAEGKGRQGGRWGGMIGQALDICLLCCLLLHCDPLQLFAQVYLSGSKAPGVMPIRSLIGFDVVMLESGQMQQV